MQRKPTMQFQRRVPSEIIHQIEKIGLNTHGIFS